MKNNNPIILPSSFDEPPLLLVSLDGFRADYLKRGLTPTLQKLSDCGVHAPYMRASFPTKTFPNHYTIITVGVWFAWMGPVNDLRVALDLRYHAYVEQVYYKPPVLSF